MEVWVFYPVIDISSSTVFFKSHFDPTNLSIFAYQSYPVIFQD